VRKILLAVLIVAAAAVASAPDRVIVPIQPTHPVFHGIETAGLWK
jgi:hypothetical protein